MSTERPETHIQRRRRLHQGWTDEDYAREEDRIFQDTSERIKLREWFAKQPPGRLRKVPIGRPYGSELSLPRLEQAVDDMRRDGTKVTQKSLAVEVGFGLTALTDWLRNQPEGTWAALKAKGRQRR